MAFCKMRTIDCHIVYIGDVPYIIAIHWMAGIFIFFLEKDCILVPLSHVFKYLPRAYRLRVIKHI